VPPTPGRGQLGCLIKDPSQVHREPSNGKDIKKSCLAHFPPGENEALHLQHQTLSKVRTGGNATMEGFCNMLGHLIGWGKEYFPALRRLVSTRGN
jgi:hypothetical protein